MTSTLIAWKLTPKCGLALVQNSVWWYLCMISLADSQPRQWFEKDPCTYAAVWICSHYLYPFLKIMTYCWGAYSYNHIEQWKGHCSMGEHTLGMQKAHAKSKSTVTRVCGYQAPDIHPKPRKATANESRWGCAWGISRVTWYKATSYTLSVHVILCFPPFSIVNCSSHLLPLSFLLARLLRGCMPFPCFEF